MSAKLTPILEVAKQILKPAGLKGMHVDDIASEAAKINSNMSLSRDDFSRRLQAALAANLKLKTQRPSFARVEGKKKGTFKRGWYRAKVDRTVPVVAQVVAPDTDRNFTGKAGELAVMSELLFWGYNASAMTVDNGIDVVASKDNKYFHIQVKTAAENEGRFSFSIKNGSFQLHHGSAMYYVFVLRRKLTNEYVIIPSTHLQVLISGGKISPGPTLSITISVDPHGRKYTLNGQTNVDVFVGNFGGIIV